MSEKSNHAASHIVRVIVIAVLSVFVMMSLSGCLGFDIHVTTPFDNLEQNIEDIEREGDDGRLRDEEKEYIEYGDGNIFVDEDGFFYDKDGNIIGNPPQTNRDVNIADDENEGKDDVSVLDYEHYHGNTGVVLNEFVNHL